MANYRVRLHELRSRSGASIEVAAGQPHVIVVCRKQTIFGLVQFRNNSAALMPGKDCPSYDQIAHCGLDSIAACLRYAQIYPDRTVLITGHTDTVANAEENRALSQHRAEAVHGMLKGDRDECAIACWGPHLSGEQRYPPTNDKQGVLWPDYIDVLNWVETAFGWPCSFARHKVLWKATRAFQESYNANGYAGNTTAGSVEVTAKFDRPTWKAVYDCYSQKLAAMLGTDLSGLEAIRGRLQLENPSIPFSSCGEYKPVDHVGIDNYPSQNNRRAEILFLAADDKPSTPCLEGTCSPDACELYDEDSVRRQRLPLPGETTGQTEIGIKMQNQDGSPAPGRYRLTLPTGTIQSVSTDGWIKEQVPDSLCGICLVEWGDDGSNGFSHRKEIVLDCNDGDPQVDAGNQLENLDYGYRTNPDRAVRLFQAEHGLALTGLVDGRIPASTVDSIKDAHDKACA